MSRLLLQDTHHIPAHKRPGDVEDGCLTFEGNHLGAKGVTLTIIDSWILNNANHTSRSHTIIKTLSPQECKALLEFLQERGGT